MHSSRLIVVALLFAVPFYAGGAELEINPGMWETTMTRTNPLTGEPKTETKTECVKQTSFNPSSMMQDAQGCDMVRDELNGDTLNFRMECSMPQGARVTVDGQYQTDGQTGQGNMDMNMNMGEMKMNMKAEWTARRIGDC